MTVPEFRYPVMVVPAAVAVAVVNTGEFWKSLGPLWPSESFAIGGVPAYAEHAALLLDLVELVDRFGRSTEPVVERRDGEARLEVARIREDADLEVAMCFDRTARREQLRDVERFRRADAARAGRDEHCDQRCDGERETSSNRHGVAIVPS